MKILFFSKYFYPHIGGVEKHVLELSRQLIQEGNEVSVITERFDNKLPAFEQYEGVSVYRINPGLNNWFKKFFIWFGLFKRFNLILQADIVHCHDVFYWYLPFRILFFWRKVFVTFHGYESYPVLKKNIIYRKITEALTSGNICIGEFMKKWYKANPTFISYGGVVIPQKFASLKQKYSALFYGRLDEQTGIMEYQKAIRLLRKKYPKFKFKVIGEGKYKKLLKGEILDGFIKNPENELVNYRFAFLSRYLSILEALAAKKLVFALYDNPIKEDYLRMSPFSKYAVIVNSAEEIESRIRYFIENPAEEEKLIDKAFSFAKKNSWKEVGKLYLKLWSR